MTVPYNITVKGVTRQLISSFEIIPRSKHENLNSELGLLKTK